MMFTKMDITNALRNHGIDDPRLAAALYEILDEMWKKKTGRSMNAMH